MFFLSSFILFNSKTCLMKGGYKTRHAKIKGGFQMENKKVDMYDTAKALFGTPLSAAEREVRESLEAFEEMSYEGKEGLLGFTVLEEENDYYDTGRSILRMFETYPEHAELLNEMLAAVCGLEHQIVA